MYSVYYFLVCLDRTESTSKCPFIADVDAFIRRWNNNFYETVWVIEEKSMCRGTRSEFKPEKESSLDAAAAQNEQLPTRHTDDSTV